MNISDEAVEAAKAVFGGKQPRGMRAALAAAAPFIAAQAWDEGFTSCAHEHMAQDKVPTRPITRTNPHGGKA